MIKAAKTFNWGVALLLLWLNVMVAAVGIMGYSWGYSDGVTAGLELRR